MQADDFEAKNEALMAATEASGETTELSTDRDDQPRTEPVRRCCASPSGTSEEAGDESEDRTGEIRPGNGRNQLATRSCWRTHREPK
jgi:hypothetical protein